MMHALKEPAKATDGGFWMLENDAELNKLDVNRFYPIAVDGSVPVGVS